MCRSSAYRWQRRRRECNGEGGVRRIPWNIETRLADAGSFDSAQDDSFVLVHTTNDQRLTHVTLHFIPRF
jgi:hypothetical protein